MNSAVWDRIEQEKRRDQTVRRVSIGAWSVTAVALLIFSGIIMMDVVSTLELVGLGAAPIGDAARAGMPMIAVIGVVSLLVAVLATVGVFFRLRTASLTEIQLRLAALEAMMTADSE